MEKENNLLEVFFKRMFKLSSKFTNHGFVSTGTISEPDGMTFEFESLDMDDVTFVFNITTKTDLITETDEEFEEWLTRLLDAAEKLRDELTDV